MQFYRTKVYDLISLISKKYTKATIKEKSHITNKMFFFKIKKPLKRICFKGIVYLYSFL